MVRIYEGSTLLGAATMMTGTTWTFALPTLLNGSSHSYTARVEDAAGNQGTDLFGLHADGRHQRPGADGDDR